MQGSSGVAQPVTMAEDNPRPLKFSSRGVGFGMETGDGEASYARNSATVQGGMLRDTGHHLTQAVHLMSLPFESQPIRIADFGCSVGANTLSWADLTTQSVLESYRTKASLATNSIPEIQYFFCDIPSNDFNTLFRDLDSKGETRPFFSAAVAGSFHDRLFPKGSLHIAISTWSVQWMSKIPEAVRDVSSPAYNKGRVWVDGGSPVVAEAYAQVHRQDLLSFFAHRAYELAPGGLLFVTCPCRAEPGRPEAQTRGEFQKASPFSGMLEDSWAELVAEVTILLHAAFGAITCHKYRSNSFQS
ncbi:hypothetical protein KC19_1G334900 [Ceratodon purpureus]|uniref:Uncharacterized protein n=1 Tax=Ceratodon purpureus TaxID=3225 RepID=A0A8T0JF28_CERPU|nr:hypothetical protein KC19_1G334900 [Ceratodon purpureus]